MKKFLVVLVGLLLVGAIFANDLNPSVEIPVNAYLKGHYEIIVDPFDKIGDDAFTMNIDPSKGGKTSTVNIRVLHNLPFMMTTEFVPLTGIEFDASPWMRTTLNGMTNNESNGVWDGNLVLTWDPDEDFDFTNYAAITEKSTIGHVLVTVAQLP